jgi:uncharacterized membrane protein YdcZ (DUF606 family)
VKLAVSLPSAWQAWRVAAFGVGPLRDLTGGPLGIVYVFGSLVAAAMLVVALAVVVPVAKARAKFF